MATTQRLGFDIVAFDKTMQAFASVQKGLGNINRSANMVKSVLTGAFSALTLGALGISIKQAVDRMDELGKAAQKIGVPVAELSKLEYAGKLADVSLESLTTTMAKFSKNLAEVAGGVQNDAGAALRAIGVAVQDANGKLQPTGQIIEDIAEKFSGMRDGANKTALAIALFGKSGADMIPLLNGGRDAIRGAGDELQRFGGVVTPEATQQAQDFNDNLTRLQMAFNGLLQQAIAPVLPKLIELTQNFIDLAKTGTPVKEWVDNTIAFFAELKPFIETTRKEVELLTEGLRYLGLVKPKPLEINIPGGDLQVGKLPPTKPLIDAPALPQSSSGVPKIAKAGSADDIYGRGFSKQLEETTKTFQELWDAMDNGIPTTNAVADAFQSISDSIGNSLGYALEGLITGTMSVQDAFRSMAQSISQTLAQLAADLLKSSLLKVLGIMAGSLAGGGGAGINIGGMMFGGLRAAGGPVTAGRGYIVGENGPEFFSPRVSGSIVPNHALGMGGGEPRISVQVNNYAGAQVQTRQDADGRLQIDVVKAEIAKDLARGGNMLSAAVERGYGLRRAGR